MTKKQREWMLKMMNPSNFLIECIDRNKGELSYHLSFDEEPVDKDIAYRAILIKYIHLHEDRKENEILIGAYKLTKRGMEALARTATLSKDDRPFTEGHKLTHCTVCKRRLYMRYGFQNTGKCGFCATGKLKDMYDIGLTW